MNRIYLDVCCFNRPYDDQSHLTVHLESEAKLYVQKGILQGSFELAWSYMMDYENSVNPYTDRKEAISVWRQIAVVDMDFSEDITLLGKQVALKGIKNKDALHIACAIKANCKYFLTTDKKLLNKNFEEISVLNPVDFIRGLEE